MRPRNEFFRVISGTLLIFGIHIMLITLIVFLIFILSSFAASSRSSYLTINPIITALSFSLFLIGVTQLLYVIPMIIIFRRRQEWGLMKGVIIGAVITALLCGGCWLVFGGFSI